MPKTGLSLYFEQQERNLGLGEVTGISDALRSDPTLGRLPQDILRARYLPNGQDADLPLEGSRSGQEYYAIDTATLYIWNGTAWDSFSTTAHGHSEYIRHDGTVTFTGDQSHGNFDITGVTDLHVDNIMGNSGSTVYILDQTMIATGTVPAFDAGVVLILNDGDSGSIGGPSVFTKLLIENDDDAFIQFLTAANTEAGIYFGDNLNPNTGGLIYDHQNDVMSIRSAGLERFFIRSSSIDLTSLMYIDNTRGIVFVEVADHPEATPNTNKGQLWANTADGLLYYTNESGTDYDLTASGGASSLDDAYNGGTDIIVDAGAINLQEASSGATSLAGTLLEIEDSGAAYISFLSPNTQESGILWADPENDAAGWITYEHGSSPPRMTFGAEGSDRMILLENAGNGAEIWAVGALTSTFNWIGFADSGATYAAGMDYDHSADLLTFKSEDTEVFFADADSLRMEIPFRFYYNATPATLTVAGEMAVDSDGDGVSVIDPVLMIYNGTALRYGFFATGYPSTDNDVMAYDQATNTVTWKAQTGGAGLNNIVEDTTPQLGGQLDVNGFAIGDGTLELLSFTETGSAVNHINITNAATLGAPIVGAAGDDLNIDLSLQPKGTGDVILGTYILDGDQVLGAGLDNYVLTYDNATGLISLEVATGGSGDAFTTIDCPNGTDPVAVGTDTLVLAEGTGVTITGDAASDTVTIATSALLRERLWFIDGYMG